MEYKPTGRCWGRNADIGVDGQPTWIPETAIDIVERLPDIVDGDCGRLDGYSITCWADGTNGYEFFAPDIDAFDNDLICILYDNGSFPCWDEFGNQIDHPLHEHFTTVSIGGYIVCGVSTDSTIKCFTDDDGTYYITFAGTFTSVSAGYESVCGLHSNGSVECWWDNFAGSSTSSAGYESVCGLHSDVSGECLWDNYDTYDTSYAYVSPSGTFTSISVNSATDYYHEFFCGLQTSGSIKCWNEDGERELSHETEGTFTTFSAGEDLICGLLTDGRIKCLFLDGHLDDDTDGLLFEPEGQFAAVTTGLFQACGLHTNGDITCWAALYEDATPYFRSLVKIRS